MDHFRDMKKVYEKTSTIDLIKNRNNKIRKLQNLHHLRGYWVKKDRARLAHMIEQLDAVIAARAAQDPLF